MDNAITVVIPVGPKPSHKRWLGEALQSVREQTVPADEILIVDDAGLQPDETGPDVRVWRPPWVLGLVHGVNMGVGLAMHELIIFLASDDRLQPWAIADCLQAYAKQPDELGYYYMDVEYSTGESQDSISGPSMVTRALWRHTGGYPPEASVGCGDYIFVNAMTVLHGRAGRFIHVESEKPPYWHRVHPERAKEIQNVRFSAAIGPVRDAIAALWLERWPE